MKCKNICSLIRNIHGSEIVSLRVLSRFVVMPLAEFLDPLAGLLEHIHGHGDDQPHVRRIIEALRKEN